MGLLEVLFIIFVVLKLCAVIDWSWWWVAAPLYPAIVLWIIVILAVVFGSIGAATHGVLRSWR